MITVYQTPVAWGTPNLSPFCFKLEAYLRMTGLPYEVKLADLRKAPKGKVPYVEFEGQRMGDSQFIIEYLKKKHGDPLDKELTPMQVAVGHTVRRMLEECTYWYIVYMRWADEAGWLAYRPVAETMVPWVVGGDIPVATLRQGMLRILHDQGTGRHSSRRYRRWPSRTSAPSRPSWARTSTCSGTSPRPSTRGSIRSW
ncbi:Tom37 metaxin N-terminal-like domain-containing protein [Melittangium boletus]|uniref:Tom37 metaxin N-terminal-like domain-containing protein n=1 Tax=Melittangium boletus TaxID=83453 RepID=UPI003DA3B718